MLSHRNSIIIVSDDEESEFAEINMSTISSVSSKDSIKPTVDETLDEEIQELIRKMEREKAERESTVSLTRTVQSLTKSRAQLMEMKGWADEQVQILTAERDDLWGRVQDHERRVFNDEMSWAGDTLKEVAGDRDRLIARLQVSENDLREANRKLTEEHEFSLNTSIDLNDSRGLVDRLITRNNKLARRAALYRKLLKKNGVTVKIQDEITDEEISDEEQCQITFVNTKVDELVKKRVEANTYRESRRIFGMDGEVVPNTGSESSSSTGGGIKGVIYAKIVSKADYDGGKREVVERYYRRQRQNEKDDKEYAEHLIKCRDSEERKQRRQINNPIKRRLWPKGGTSIRKKSKGATTENVEEKIEKQKPESSCVDAEADNDEISGGAAASNENK